MRIMLKKLLALSLAAGLAVPAAAQTIRSYITCPDRSELFAQQKHAAEFSTQRQENRNYIIIDPRQSYQRIDGFGYALTGGSAEHLMKMSPEARKSLLKELFDPQQGIGISCIRLTLGASDLNSFVFYYDDMPARKDDNLPAEVWRAELNNALSGIAQLKGIDRKALANQLSSTSRELLMR